MVIFIKHIKLRQNIDFKLKKLMKKFIILVFYTCVCLQYIFHVLILRNWKCKSLPLGATRTRYNNTDFRPTDEKIIVDEKHSESVGR